MAADAGQAIDDMLTLARMDAAKQVVAFEKLRLDLLAEAVAEKHDRIDVATVPTVVEGDPGLLRRAIDNLVRNAIQHGRADDKDVPITLTVYPHRVEVADEG